jgi:hypothetical protein
VDHAERYLQLTLLGREAFLGAVAPAALVRRRSASLPGNGQATGSAGDRRPRIDTFEHETTTTTLLGGDDSRFRTAPGEDPEIAIYPLAKKPGASFADMITVGRTANNDVVLNDVTVSRFHAFFRQRERSWIVCDAGSKNGTSVDGRPLEARKELPVVSGAAVRIGDIETRFYTAAELYEVLTT